MIWQSVLDDAPLSQGDLFTECPSPYREHLAQHYATTYARIALPEPYETES